MKSVEIYGFHIWFNRQSQLEKMHIFQYLKDFLGHIKFRLADFVFKMYLMGMDAKKRHSDLTRRRETVARLIEQLQEELRFLDGKLGLIEGPIHVRMDKNFFQKELMPILESNSQEGLSTIELFKKISDSGLRIYENQLRVFLSRCKKNGLLDLDRSKQPARWKVARK